MADEVTRGPDEPRGGILARPTSGDEVHHATRVGRDGSGIARRPRHQVSMVAVRPLVPHGEREDVDEGVSGFRTPLAEKGFARDQRKGTDQKEAKEVAHCGLMPVTELSR